MNDYLQTKELYHHGIKGQRWGVRRYQNEDGTLTDAGRKRVTNHLGKIEPAYYTHRGFIKDKTKTYIFLRKNNIITDSDVKKQRKLEDKYIDAVKKINSKAFVTYYTRHGLIKDKTKTYIFSRENNIITDSDAKKQRKLENKYINAVKKINSNKKKFSKTSVNRMVLVSEQENQKLNKMKNDILFNLGSVSMKFLNTNERSIFKQQMAREYLRTLMYNDEKFYKKNN